jgi:hypothetical protein
MKRSSLELPLVAADPASPSAPEWHGWVPAEPLAGAAAAPEPDAPQGEYSAGASPAPLSVPLAEGAAHRVELLAPAGGPESAFAASSTAPTPSTWA